MLDIIKWGDPKTSQNWIIGDSKKDWKKNCKQKGSTWAYYSADDIEYKHNSYGYRTEEFEDLDWAKSTLFFGCSHIYGVGNYLKDTVPVLYSNIAKCPVINMGINAGNIEALHHNTHALIEHNFIPKQVIIFWPYVVRQLYYKGLKFNSKFVPRFLGPWGSPFDDDKRYYHYAVINAENYITKSYLLKKSIVDVWRLQGVKVYTFAFNDKIQHLGEFRYGCPKLPEVKDFARDTFHYGHETNTSYAEYIHKYITRS